MSITFHQAEIKDKNQVLNLLKEAAERINNMNINHWQYWKHPSKENINWIEEGIKNNEFFFIKDMNAQNTAMVRIQDEDLPYWGKQNIKAKYIHSLVVNQGHNGKGIGAKILQEIENKAKKENCKYLRLDADSENVKLCEYYEKLDFKKVQIKEAPISNSNLYQKEIR